MADDIRKFQTAGDVFKVDDSLGLVFGWAIICKMSGEDYFDSQDDHIPEESMLKAATAFMSDSRVAKEMHAGDQKGEFVFAWPMTAEIAKAMGIETDKTGLMVAAKFPPEVLAKFKSRELTGFSIGGQRITDVEVA